MLTAELSCPVPLGGLVKDDIAADVDAPGRWIEQTVRLGARLVADEDGAPAPVIELLQVRSRQLHVRDAAKRAQVLDSWRAPCPELVGGLASYALGRGPVTEIDGRRDCLTPELARELLRLEHTPGSSHHRLIAPLDDAVLLR